MHEDGLPGVEGSEDEAETPAANFAMIMASLAKLAAKDAGSSPLVLNMLHRKVASSSPGPFLACVKSRLSEFELIMPVFHSA